MEKKKLFNLRLSYAVLQCLTKDAETQNRPVSYIAREILESHYGIDKPVRAESVEEVVVVRKEVKAAVQKKPEKALKVSGVVAPVKPSLEGYETKVGIDGQLRYKDEFGRWLTEDDILAQQKAPVN